MGFPAGSGRRKVPAIDDPSHIAGLVIPDAFCYERDIHDYLFIGRKESL